MIGRTCGPVLQDPGANRLSKFEFFPGDTAATLASEEILLTTTAKATSIHAAGWCGFKPSDYGNNVRNKDFGWCKQHPDLRMPALPALHS